MKYKDEFRASAARGFTLVEILVAMVVLAIGLLGMAAMTVLVMRGNRGAGDLTSATNICQLKLEALKDESWDNLGNWDAYANVQPTQWGYSNAEMAQEAGLNSEGKDEATMITELSLLYNGQTLIDEVAKRGPYKFARSFVICRGNEYQISGNSTVPPGSSLSYTAAGTNEPPATPDCKVDPVDSSSRTKPLSCQEADITTAVGSGNKEKKIKVLCTWHSTDGQCHSVHLDTTVVKL